MTTERKVQKATSPRPSTFSRLHQSLSVCHFDLHAGVETQSFREEGVLIPFPTLFIQQCPSKGPCFALAREGGPHHVFCTPALDHGASSCHGIPTRLKDALDLPRDSKSFRECWSREHCHPFSWPYAILLQLAIQYPKVKRNFEGFILIYYYYFKFWIFLIFIF